MHRRHSPKSSIPKAISRPRLPCAASCEGVAGPLRRRASGRPDLMPEDLRDGCDANLALTSTASTSTRMSCTAQSRRLLARASATDRDPCRLRGMGFASPHRAREREIVRSCLMLAVQTHGASVERRGLSDSGEIADLQAAFRARNALQCGFCSTAMLMAAQDLLKRILKPDAESGYRAIFRQLLPLHATRPLSMRSRPQLARNGTHADGPWHPQSLRSRCCRPRIRISARCPTPNLERLMQGRGLYVSDMNCRGWRMWYSCARPMPMRESLGSTQPRRGACPASSPRDRRNS